MVTSDNRRLYTEQQIEKFASARAVADKSEE